MKATSLEDTHHTNGEVIKQRFCATYQNTEG